MSSVTRGYGLLESWLARLRSSMAERLIPASLRNGRLVDIGCGQTPIFLLRTDFGERIGIDQHVSDNAREACARAGVTLIGRDMETNLHLPFPDASADAVTMLAVFEHIENNKLVELVREIHRVLKPGGAYIITTPASWADPILKILCRLHLVSQVELDEHEKTYTRAGVADVLARGGFRPEDIETGSFEFGMNLWARAVRR